MFLEGAEDDGVDGGGGSGRQGSSVEGAPEKGDGNAAAGQASSQNLDASSPHLSSRWGLREEGMLVRVRFARALGLGLD